MCICTSSAFDMDMGFDSIFLLTFFFIFAMDTYPFTIIQPASAYFSISYFTVSVCMLFFIYFFAGGGGGGLFLFFYFFCESN